MIQLFKKSAFALLLYGALLFVPHMGECEKLKDRVYGSEAQASDGTPKTSIKIQGSTINGHFHRGSSKVPFSGVINSAGLAEVAHNCTGSCPDGVAAKSIVKFEASGSGKLVATSHWIDPKTSEAAKASEELVEMA